MSNIAPVIIFLGKIGSGKTLQAQMLAETLKADHFSVGSLIRQKHIDDERVHRGELLPDALVNDVVREEIRSVDVATPILIDGFPRRVSQKEWLAQLLRDEGRTDVRVLHLAVSDGEVDNRLSSRGRKDDTPQAVALRKQIFAREVIPVIEAYTADGILYSIDGEGEVEDVQKRIISELGI